MSLPRFYCEELPEAGLVEFSKSESQHASQVLRLPVGARVELFDGKGSYAEAELEAVGKRSTSARMVSPLTAMPTRFGLHLAVSLPKGDRQKVLVDGLTQLGAAQLIPLICERGVAQPTENAMDRLRRAVIEACKQCRRNRLMQVSAPMRIQDLATDETFRGNSKLVAHPYGEPMELRQAISSASQSVLIAIGPEGGFTDSEVSTLVDSDWQPVGLGSQILRIEVAALAAASYCVLANS